MNGMNERTITSFRKCCPATFHFEEPGNPCAYWSNGAHIVNDGVCRCGKEFILGEKEHPRMTSPVGTHDAMERLLVDAIKAKLSEVSA
jgi:hypothetical protein